MLADRYVWNALRNKLSFILNISYSHFFFSFPSWVRVPKLQNHRLTYLKWDPLMISTREHSFGLFAHVKHETLNICLCCSAIGVNVTSLMLLTALRKIHLRLSKPQTFFPQSLSPHIPQKVVSKYQSLG